MYITDENDFKALKQLILDRKYSRNQGKGVETHCSKFEEDFAQKMGSKHSLLVTSGTNALVCALIAVGVTEGDEVIIPSYTFFATAAAVINVGATPVIANIDHTLMIDPNDVSKLISKKTKAIIAVHMDGHSCQMDAIAKIAKANGLFIIEDVAQAVGGMFKGQRLGSIGDVGCFSFNVDKIISAGEGGAVVTNNRIFFEKSLCVQDASALFGSTHKEEFKNIVPFIGQSMRVSEITGALMSVQLSRLDYILDNLRERKKIIKELFLKADLPIVISNDEEGDCCTSFYITAKTPDENKEILSKINTDKLIAIPITAKPAHVCWQWMHLLAEVRPKELYRKSLFLNSIDTILRTSKIDVPFDMDLNEVENFGKNMINKIKA